MRQPPRAAKRVTDRERIDQLTAEVAIVNSIQQGMAEALDFKSIIDLVGDKLREVFHTGDIGIRWYDPSTNLIHYLYQYEHGKRLYPPPLPPKANFLKLAQTRRPTVVNNLAEYVAKGLVRMEGTDQAISMVSVPILGRDQVLGTVAIDDYERENAFGEAEVRLLSTVAASMGVALENARLFDETQRLLKETEQRAAELAVRSGSGSASPRATWWPVTRAPTSARRTPASGTR